MEVAIVECHAALLAGGRAADCEIIIEHEAQLGVADQVALHLNHAVDGGIDDHAIGVEKDGQLLKNVHEDLVGLGLLRVQLANRLLDGSRSHSARLENLWPPAANRLLSLGFGLNEHWLIDNELADVLRGHQLRMAIVYHLVNNLIYEDEILPDGFFVEHAAIISENLHHSVNDVENGRRRHICLRRCHEVNPKLLREEVIHTVHMLSHITNFSQSIYQKKWLTRILSMICLIW